MQNKRIFTSTLRHLDPTVYNPDPKNLYNKHIILGLRLNFKFTVIRDLQQFGL